MHNSQFLKAKIDWLSEFTYKLTIVNVGTTDYPFKKGDVLISEITDINGSNFFYKSCYKGKVVKGNFIKIADATN
jgi:hypothetical protein